MKHLQESSAEAEAFAAQAQRRASELLVSTRNRGESVRDEGDFIARAMDQIYMDERPGIRPQVRRRGRP